MNQRSLKELAEELKDKQVKVGDLLNPKLHRGFSFLLLASVNNVIIQ